MLLSLHVRFCIKVEVYYSTSGIGPVLFLFKTSVHDICVWEHAIMYAHYAPLYRFILRENFLGEFHGSVTVRNHIICECCIVIRCGSSTKIQSANFFSQNMLTPLIRKDFACEINLLYSKLYSFCNTGVMSV